MDFDFVTDRLAIGTTPQTAADVKLLQDSGITHLINCRDDLDDAPILAGSGIIYLWNGTPDFSVGQLVRGTHKPVSWFKTGLDFALPIFPLSRLKLFLHCIMGANRSATMAFAILRALGLTTAECFSVIDSHRLIDIPGLIECGWWRDANDALKQLGFIG